jgi:threonine dehydrogenase-like Zn-dependent dehydrogenase
VGIVGRDGAFAEMLSLPLTNLHAVPDGVSDDAAVFTEPLAAAYEMLEQVPVRSGERAVVLGDGRLGQLCAVVLARAGCSVVVEGRHADKMARLERFGVSTAPAGAPFSRAFDRVVEATGSPLALERALELVRARGTIILKSTYHGATEVELAGLVIDEVTIVGSRCGPFEPAIEHLVSDSTIVDDMISARFPLERAREAFARACDSESLKVVFTP